MRKKRGCVLIFLLALSNQVLLGTGLAPVDLYIDAGNTSSDFTDTEGHTWLPDQSFTGGGTEGFHDPISNAPYGTAAIYQTNRLGGSFEYAFGPADGLAAGHNYTVTLLFCELYFDRPSQRLFSVTANGSQSLLLNFDVYLAAGGKDVPLTQTFQIAADNTGALSLQFAALVNNAILAGIHIQGNVPARASPPATAPAVPPAVAAGPPAAGNPAAGVPQPAAPAPLPRPAAVPPGPEAYPPQPVLMPGGPPGQAPPPQPAAGLPHVPNLAPAPARPDTPTPTTVPVPAISAPPPPSPQGADSSSPSPPSPNPPSTSPSPPTSPPHSGPPQSPTSVVAQGTPVQTTGTSAQSTGVLFVSKRQLAGIILGIFFGLLIILLIVVAISALLLLKYLRKNIGGKAGRAVQIDAQG